MSYVLPALLPAQSRQVQEKGRFKTGSLPKSSLELLWASNVMAVGRRLLRGPGSQRQWSQGDWGPALCFSLPLSPVSRSFGRSSCSAGGRALCPHCNVRCGCEAVLGSVFLAVVVSPLCVCFGPALAGGFSGLTSPRHPQHAIGMDLWSPEVNLSISCVISSHLSQQCPSTQCPHRTVEKTEADN